MNEQSQFFKCYNEKMIKKKRKKETNNKTKLIILCLLWDPNARRLECREMKWREREQQTENEGINTQDYTRENKKQVKPMIQ